jgi:hypothetical protein
LSCTSFGEEGDDRRRRLVVVEGAAVGVAVGRVLAGRLDVAAERLRLDQGPLLGGQAGEGVLAEAVERAVLGVGVGAQQPAELGDEVLGVGAAAPLDLHGQRVPPQQEPVAAGGGAAQGADGGRGVLFEALGDLEHLGLAAVVPVLDRVALAVRQVGEVLALTVVQPGRGQGR